jgi:hypothetical protein
VFRRPGQSRRLSVAAVALATLASLVGGGPGAAADAGAACGASTLATIATADASMLTNIYRNELAGTEVSFDVAKVTTATDLLSAVALGDRVAARKAAIRLVYHRAWHIVRLRALDASGRVLTDIGGPDVIAPVSGVLRSATGAVIGSFVLSVQDDLGVTKLEHRFVGDPIGIYARGRLVAQRGTRFPPAPPSGPGVTLGGVRYSVVTETYAAFPSGTLRAVILIAPPARSLTSQPCATVRAGEFGRVARRLTGLLGPLTQHYYGYAFWVQIYTGAEVFVRAPDGTQLTSSAGAGAGAGPTVLPTSGTVSYQGTSWLVFSFEPYPPTRVYMLIAPA